MTPECCQKCHNRKEDGGCTADGKGCLRWQTWFANEWEGIRLSAQKIKKKRQKRRPTK